jgi:hypothetical protein
MQESGVISNKKDYIDSSHIKKKICGENLPKCGKKRLMKAFLEKEITIF